MIPCSSALTHFLVFLSNPQLTNTSEYEWVPIAIGEGGEYKIQYGAQFSAGPSFWSLFVQRLFFEPKMILNKKQLFPKVAWFLVFRPAEFWVYSYYILWAHWGDAKVGEFGFPENVFVYGYSNYMV